MKKENFYHETIFVDFKNKKVISRKSTTLKKPITKKTYDFSNFNQIPKDSNFIDFSEQERMEYSEHILNHIHDASFSDLVHWANHGMLDLVKVDKILNLDNPGLKPKRKK